MTALFYGCGIIGIVLILWRTFALAFDSLRARYQAWQQLRNPDKVVKAEQLFSKQTLDDREAYLRNRLEAVGPAAHERQLARLHAEEEAARVRQESVAGTVDPNWNHPPGYWPPPVTDEVFDAFLDRTAASLEQGLRFGVGNAERRKQ